MTQTSRANEAHDHKVAGKTSSTGGISHTHTVDTTAEINAAIKDHVDTYHAPVVEPPPVEPPPVVTPPPTGTSKPAASIADIKALLADDSVGEIVVANGTYRVSSAGGQQADSLWIGKQYAGRSNPVTIRAATKGGVTFDGGGAGWFGGISFQEGAHHQTWDGFVFANGTPTSTGVVVVGGYANMAAAHHITMRNLTFPSSIRGNIPQDHDIYISATSAGTGGPHDLLFEDITADGSGGIMSALCYGHTLVEGQPADNAWNVTARRCTLTKLNTAIVVWEGVLHDLLFEDIKIVSSGRFGVRYENAKDTKVVFRRVNSTGSGQAGFYSSLGTPPPGVIFDTCSFN